MVENIVKSIQDLRALSDLYLNNAISFNELGNCKEKALSSLRDSRDKLSIAEIVEPLQSLREVYLEDILSLDEYSVSRGLLMNHIRLSSGSIDSYKEVYSLYKQGLLSLIDLHEAKKEILGEDSDDVRSGNHTNINRLRDTYSPFVPGYFNGGPGNQYRESSEGVWYNTHNPSVIVGDAQISTYYFNPQYQTLDWGTEATGLSTVNRLRNLIDNDTYVEEEVLIQLQGLTNSELVEFLTDMMNTQNSDNLETLDVFKRLIPIITL